MNEIVLFAKLRVLDIKFCLKLIEVLNLFFLELRFFESY